MRGLVIEDAIFGILKIDGGGLELWEMCNRDSMAKERDGQALSRSMSCSESNEVGGAGDCDTIEALKLDDVGEI